MALSENIRQSVAPEAEEATSKPPLLPPKSISGLRLVASQLLRAMERVMLLLGLLIYSIFLAEMVFHVVAAFSIPLAILREHLVPAGLAFLEALGPAGGVFYHEVVGALLLFLSALLLPLTAGCCLQLFLFPSYFKLVKLMW